MNQDPAVLAQLADMQRRDELPRKALSLRQPWAWCVIHGGKTVENRTWPTAHRGPVLIHAALRLEEGPLADMLDGYHPVTGLEMGADRHQEVLLAQARHEWIGGGFIGVVDVIDCVETSGSDWFVGPYGFVLANPRPLPFMPWRGLLNFFPVNFDTVQRP